MLNFPKVTNLEQFVIKKQLSVKGRITTPLSMAGMLWWVRGLVSDQGLYNVQ